MSHSFSQLEVARFCGQAPLLSKQHGAGRPAAMSKARHAQMAGELEASSLLASLTEDELNEIRQWKSPAPVKFGAGELTYADAKKEWRVGLTKDLRYCDYDDPSRLTRGIIDVAWCTEVEGMKVAVVGDAKKEPWTADVDDLQLIAGGFAAADHWGCDAFTVGLWILSTSEWVWGPTVDMYGLGAARWAEIIPHAAQNDSFYNKGPHCQKCYSRLHCPEYLMPPELADSSLAPWVSFEGRSLDMETVAHALELAQRAKDTAAAVLDNVKAWVDQNGPLKAGGRAYKRIQMPGRKSVRLQLLKDSLGDEAEPFITEGKPYASYRWGKE